MSENDNRLKEIEEKVKKIISEQLNVEITEIKPEASFIEDLGADSLDTVELVMAFEDEFGIEIYDGIPVEKSFDNHLVLQSDVNLQRKHFYLLDSWSITLILSVLLSCRTCGRIQQIP